MEGVVVTLVGILGALVTGFLWFLKFLARKLFGKEGSEDHGLLGNLVVELRQNTESIRELRDYQKEHARAQRETNQTLQDLLQATRETKHG